MKLAADIHRLDSADVLDERDPKKKAAKIQALAQQWRLDVFDVLHAKQTGHWGGSASAAEILAALYFGFLRVRPEEPAWPERDRLVLSKGHAAPMLYAALGARGFFPPDELCTFRDLDSRMQGHPCMATTPGVDMSSGALGHGLSVGLGMALAARVQNRDSWTFVIVGEGCLDEGQTWEAVMAAAKFRPARLVLLVDHNGVQLDGPSETIMPIDPLADKLRAFRWNVAPETVDGHSVEAVLASFDWLRAQSDWPAAIVFKTIKGRGVAAMEGLSKWHGAPIDGETYAQGRAEMMERLNALMQEVKR